MYVYDTEFYPNRVSYMRTDGHDETYRQFSSLC
jgi:hypothetical protein